jgi:hypothetical protein
MNRPDDSGGLNQGGPSDQASAKPEAQDPGRQGSQSGRPQRQETEAPGSAATGPRHPPVARPEEARGVSETEREAGTPDPRATTDWNHGEGEPPANKSDA